MENIKIYLVYSIDLNYTKELERIFSTKQKADDFIMTYSKINPAIEYEIEENILF